MAIVNQVQKRTRLSVADIIKYQFWHHCLVNSVNITETEIDCLSHLAVLGEFEIIPFCQHIVDQEILSNPQSVRNLVVKLQTKNLVLKRKKSRTIYVNPDIKVVTEHPIFLDIKMISNDPV